MINWLKVKQRFYDWMKIRGDYDRYPDSYSFSQQGIENHLLQAIKYRQQIDQAILLITHFPSTFERLQGLLENAGHDFGIAPLKFGPDCLLDLIEKATPGSPPILLVLAPTFDDSSLDRPLPPRRNLKVSFMVLERHPSLAEDQRIDQFARIWPFSVRIGYLLSMDDPVVKYCIPPTIIEMLKQMGFGDQQLVTSKLVTRQMERLLKRVNLPARSAASARPVAEDSAEEWLKQLPPPPHGGS